MLDLYIVTDTNLPFDLVRIFRVQTIKSLNGKSMGGLDGQIFTLIVSPGTFT